MFKFLIKKAFFDMWDNIFWVFILNIGYISIIAISIILPIFIIKSNSLLYIFVIIGVVAVSIYNGIVSSVCKEISDYKSVSFVFLLKALKETFLSSFIISIISIFYVIIFLILFNIYLSIKSSIGLFTFSILIITNFIILFTSQYFFSIQTRLNKNPIKIIKKSFLLFLDNPLFSIGLFLGSILIFLISIFTLFIIVGFSSISLWQNVGLKLRLYKYDYLEEKSGKINKKIPWDTLLDKDKEAIGKRTLIGMIFPWRE